MSLKLLAPVGNFEMLAAAIKNGADEIYFGISGISMRQRPRNFQISEMAKIKKICQKSNCKPILAINSLIFENEITKVEKILSSAKKAGIDAIIAADFAVINKAIEKKMEIHISTQFSVANSESFAFFAKLPGVNRIVLARELDLLQISKIAEFRDKYFPNVEIETFCHGAMCVSVSGRCFLSEFLWQKSANRGECLQPCRRKYKIFDTDSGSELLVGENYLLSPRDLCSISFLEKLVAAGISVFKIEGRARSIEYVASTTKIYKNILEKISLGKKILASQKKIAEKKLQCVFNRGFSPGFFLGQPEKWQTKKYGSVATEKKFFIGVVTRFFKRIKVIEIKIQNHELKIGDEIFLQGSKIGSFRVKIKSIEMENCSKKIGKKGEIVGIFCSPVVEKACKNDKIFLIATE